MPFIQHISHFSIFNSYPQPSSISWLLLVFLRNLPHGHSTQLMEVVCTNLKGLHTEFQGYRLRSGYHVIYLAASWWIPCNQAWDSFISLLRYDTAGVCWILYFTVILGVWHWGNLDLGCKDLPIVNKSLDTAKHMETDLKGVLWIDLCHFWKKKTWRFVGYTDLCDGALDSI